MQDRPPPRRQELKPTGKAVGPRPRPRRPASPATAPTVSASCLEYPNLAGQHEDYLRHSPGVSQRPAQNAVMAGMAAPLTDADIKELARYYSSQRPALCSTNEVRDKGKCKGL